MREGGSTHRLFVLEQVDQAVQHRSQVPEGDGGRSTRRAHGGKVKEEEEESGTNGPAAPNPPVHPRGTPAGGPTST